MGGYGAMYVGINQKYDNIANLSVAVIIQNRIDNTDDHRFDCLIETVSNAQSIEKLLLEPVKSKIYSYCGTNDFLWTDNCIVNKLIAENGCECKIATDGGAHDFESWDQQIPLVFNYFFGGLNNGNN